MRFNFRTISKLGFLLVIIGYLVPMFSAEIIITTLQMNGFQYAELAMELGYPIYAVFMYGSFIFALAGLIIGVLLLAKKNVPILLDWIIILACTVGILFSIHSFDGELEAGAYVVVLGLIVALAAQIVSTVKKENGVLWAQEELREGELRQRGFASYILLGPITGGIYILWRIHVLARDINEMCKEDGKKTSGLLMFALLSMITFSIYYFVWLFKVGSRLRDNADRFNITINEGGGTILLWSTLGSILFGIGPFIAMFIIFKNTNRMIAAYNEKLAV